MTLARHCLEVGLTARNPDVTPYDFSAALHTYLRVGNIAAASIEGLGGLRYRDSVQAATLGEDAATSVDAEPVVRFRGETDRIYYNAHSTLRLRETPMAAEAARAGAADPPAVSGASLDLAMQGFQDVVVWNPGADKGATLNDLPRHGYRQMVCIEAARIGQPVTLAPGESWMGSQTLYTTTTP